MDSIYVFIIIVVGGIVIYFFLRNSKQNNRLNVMMSTINKDAIERKLENYYHVVSVDYYKNFRNNDVKLQFMVRDLNEKHQLSCDYIISAEKFGFSPEESVFAIQWAKNKAQEYVKTNIKRDLGSVDIFIFLYEFTRKSSEIKALDDANIEFDLFNKDADYYMKLHSRISNEIIELIKSVSLK